MSFGVIVNTRTAPATTGPLIDTGTLLLAAPTAGAFGAVGEITSMDDLVSIWGSRVGAMIPTYDAVETHLRTGGRRILLAPFQADYSDALTLFSDKKWGPGQLAVIGVPPGQQLFEDMQSVCDGYNRVAIRDVSNTTDVSQMEADAALAPENDDLGATFGPWCVVPGPAGILGAGPREVPASVVIAALCNRVDKDGNPNRAAAGFDYALDYVTDLVHHVTDTERSALFRAGVNCFNLVFNRLENYGFQTNIAEDITNPYWQFNCSRGRMYLKARCAVRGEPYMFRPIDGRNVLAGALQGDLEAECKKLYDNFGLYGADGTPQSAYQVRVTETLDEVAQGILHAEADVCWTMHTRSVQVDLVTVPIGSMPTAPTAP